MCPCCWSGGARREGGVSPVCCVCVKQEKAPCCCACWVRVGVPADRLVVVMMLLYWGRSEGGGSFVMCSCWSTRVSGRNWDERVSVIGRGGAKAVEDGG